MQKSSVTEQSWSSALILAGRAVLCLPSARTEWRALPGQALWQMRARGFMAGSVRFELMDRGQNSEFGLAFEQELRARQNL